MTPMKRFFCLSVAAVLSSTSACTPGSTSLGGDDLSGTWTGHIELLQFASGSDKVTFDISAVHGSSVTGTVLFGDGTLLPPPTSATAVYPPSGVELFDNPGTNEVEGFDYTMLDTDFANDRLQITLQLLQLWDGWCALQTPVANPEPHPASRAYWCGPAVADPTLGTDEQQDCEIICQCTATSCTAGPTSTAAISFDLMLEGGALQGSVGGLVGGNQTRNVTLTQP